MQKFVKKRPGEKRFNQKENIGVKFEIIGNVLLPWKREVSLQRYIETS